MAHITLENIYKSYDGKTNVLQDVNIEVNKGDFLVLVGPSGCGKSTLLRMIAGLEKINQGNLYINQTLANDMLPKDRDLSMVFQNYALYPHMSVKENILFGLDVKKISKQEQEKRLLDTVKMMGLTDYIHRKPGSLSGGQRQRVALARSICSQSTLCLMDEPLSNLDAKLRATMRTEIRSIQKQLGFTTVYVTHDQVEAMTMSDSIVVLNEGKVQQIGTPLQLYNCPSNQFVAGFIGSPQMNFFKGVKSGENLVLEDVISIKLPLDFHDLHENQEIIVGIRSEHLSKEIDEYSKEVTIKTCEFLGSETLIQFSLNDKTYISKWSGQYNLINDQKIMMNFNPYKFHYFDSITKDRISLIREE